MHPDIEFIVRLVIKHMMYTIHLVEQQVMMKELKSLQQWKEAPHDCKALFLQM